MASRKQTIVLPEPKEMGAWIELGGTLLKFLVYGTLAVVATVGAYYAFSSRLDRLDQNIASQSEALSVTNKSIEKMAIAMQKIADEAITSSDLTAFCMQLEIANTKRGWECPFSGVTAGRTLAKPLKRITLNPQIPSQ